MIRPARPEDLIRIAEIEVFNEVIDYIARHDSRKAAQAKK